MIKVENLTKQFGDVVAVDDVSFAVDEGMLLILIGTSGCGKTTTLKMLNRLIEPSAGKIYIGDENIRAKDPHELRRNIGYVIQNIGLFPHYTVAQNIATVPHLLHWDKQRIVQRSRELLEIVGLPQDFMQRYPRELSGGQRQRVGLARALAADPPLVLLDEPFGALDPLTRKQVQDEFHSLQISLHKTMVMVTHDMFEACELGDKICLMDRGKIQQMGTPKELLFSPANQFVSDFFAANRFFLELQVLTLADVLPDIRSQEVKGNIESFTRETNLLDVVEKMEGSLASAGLVVQDDDGETIMQTTCDEVFAAFYKTKARLAA